jgi:hypothetical protein
MLASARQRYGLSGFRGLSAHIHSDAIWPGIPKLMTENEFLQSLSGSN